MDFNDTVSEWKRDREKERSFKVKWNWKLMNYKAAVTLRIIKKHYFISYIIFIIVNLHVPFAVAWVEFYVKLHWEKLYLVIIVRLS